MITIPIHFAIAQVVDAVAVDIYRFSFLIHIQSVSYIQFFVFRCHSVGMDADRPLRCLIARPLRCLRA